MADSSVLQATVSSSHKTPKRKRTATSNSSRKPKSKAVECPICLSPRKPCQLIQLDTCGCTYCKSCLGEALTAGLTPNDFPARCCGRSLDVTSLEKHIPKALARQYRNKTEEVVSSEPVYCAECGAFISAEAYDEIAKSAAADGVRAGFGTCGMCHRKTCIKKDCKMLKSQHLGIHAICPSFLEDESLAKVAQRRGWKRCPRCFSLTEKSTGCSAMRCRCKAEWCYECGKLTKASEDSCTCHLPAYVDLVDNLGDRMGVDEELPELDVVLGLALPGTAHQFW